MTEQLAIRVMKARRASTCPICLGPIRPGNQIALTGVWQCVRHVIERQQQHQDQEDGRP